MTSQFQLYINGQFEDGAAQFDSTNPATGQVWAKMPEVMIRKCALVNALREAFPGDLGGVYDSSEMGQAIDADFEEMGAA